MTAPGAGQASGAFETPTPARPALVHLPSSLVALFPGAPRRIEVAGATLAEVLDGLEAAVPGIRDRLVESGPAIRPHINIYVTGERADLATAIPPGAAVHVVPAVSGGA